MVTGPESWYAVNDVLSQLAALEKVLSLRPSGVNTPSARLGTTPYVLEKATARSVTDPLAGLGNLMFEAERLGEEATRSAHRGPLVAAYGKRSSLLSGRSRLPSLAPNEAVLLAFVASQPEGVTVPSVIPVGGYLCDIRKARVYGIMDGFHTNGLTDRRAGHANVHMINELGVSALLDRGVRGTIADYLGDPPKGGGLAGRPDEPISSAERSRTVGQ